jgi:hypothetical protein
MIIVDQVSLGINTNLYNKSKLYNSSLSDASPFPANESVAQWRNSQVQVDSLLNSIIHLKKSE